MGIFIHFLLSWQFGHFPWSHCTSLLLYGYRCFTSTFNNWNSKGAGKWQTLRKNKTQAWIMVTVDLVSDRCFEISTNTTNNEPSSRKLWGGYQQMSKRLIYKDRFLLSAKSFFSLATVMITSSACPKKYLWQKIWHCYKKFWFRFYFSIIIWSKFFFMTVKSSLSETI